MAIPFETINQIVLSKMENQDLPYREERKLLVSIISSYDWSYSDWIREYAKHYNLSIKEVLQINSRHRRYYA